MTLAPFNRKIGSIEIKECPMMIILTLGWIAFCDVSISFSSNTFPTNVLVQTHIFN